ncbi:MAG: hypothetical protein MUC85_11665 [Anaerolineales bacterium]|nr:hypothetical protein [Anaerolineales bacterium]
MEAGDFEILVGASSRDIRLSAHAHLAAAHGVASPVDPAKLAAYYNLSKKHPFTQADFEALLGRPVPPNLPTPKGSYSLNTPLKEMSGSFVGRQMFKMMVGQIDKMVKGQEDTPTGLLLRAMAQEMPLRSMLMFGGPLNRPKVEALLLMINGHFLKGLLAFIRARSA